MGPWVPGPWNRNTPRYWVRISRSPAARPRRTSSCWALLSGPSQGAQPPLLPGERTNQSESETEGREAGNDLELENPIGSHQPVKSPSSWAQALISPEIQVKARPQASFPKSCGRSPFPCIPSASGLHWVLLGPTLLQHGRELPAGTWAEQLRNCIFLLLTSLIVIFVPAFKPSWVFISSCPSPVRLAEKASSLSGRQFSQRVQR